MNSARSSLLDFIGRIIATIYLAAVLSPAQYGIDPARLPKLSFGLDVAYADDDVSHRPLGSALSLGRTVRALDPQATSVEVRYAVTNTGDATLHSVRLGTVLQSDVTLQGSAPEANRSGQELSFSLGDISPRASRVATVRMSRSVGGNGAFDTGAIAFASIDGVPVSAATAPATIKLFAGDAALLGQAPEVPIDDPSLIAQAGKLNHDPVRIFLFVRDHIRNDVYSGSLRGARGTLLHGGGNSLDKSSLLIALLRASGVPARYAQGTLPKGLAQQIILSMFPVATNIVGYIKAGDDTADPANDPTLLADAMNHTWVQFDATGNGFQSADPSLSQATVGVAFASPTAVFAAVPDAQRHKVTLRVRAESTIASLLGGSLSDEQTVLQATYPAAELSGCPLHLQHRVDTTNTPSPTFSYNVITYSPYFIVDRSDGSATNDELLRGSDYQEVLTSFPFGSSIVTGVFLDVITIAPGGDTRSFRRTVVDRIGFDVRHNGSTAPIPSPTQPIFTDFDTTTVAISTGDVPDAFGARRATKLVELGAASDGVNPQIQALAALNLSALTPEQQALQKSTRELDASIFREFTAFLADRFLSLSTTTNQTTEAANFARIYPSSPRVIIVTQRVSLVNHLGSVKTNIDLLKDDARVVLSQGQSTKARFFAGIQHGIAENVAETQTLDLPGVAKPLSTATIFGNAKLQNIQPAYLTSANAALLEQLPLSAQAKARIAIAIHADKVVIVPSAMVLIDGKQTIGWYESDGHTGDTVGVLEDGSHGGNSIEWQGLVNAVLETFFYGGYFSLLGFIGGFVPTMIIVGLASVAIIVSPNSRKEDYSNFLSFLQGAFGLAGLQAGAPGVGDLIPSVIEELAALTAGVAAHVHVTVGIAVVVGFAAGVELALQFLIYLVNHSDPLLQSVKSYLTTAGPSNVVTTEVSVVPTLAAGTLVSAQQTELSEVSGQIAGTWTGPLSVAATVSAFDASSATVIDQSGQPVGVGPVSLGGSTGIPIRIEVAGSIAIDGAGSLSFFGPSTALLGSAGQWNQFSASMSGGGTLHVSTGRLSLNGRLLSDGEYTIQASAASFRGSGAGLAANFVNATQISLNDASVIVGSGAGAVTVAGAPYNTPNGFAGSSFHGSFSAASSGQLDTVSLNGSAAHVAMITMPVSSVAADQNTAVTVEPTVLSSFGGEYSLTARAPPGWTVQFTENHKLSILPAGGLQPATYPVYLSARSKTDQSLVTTARVDVVVGATLPGLSFAVVPESALVVFSKGAEVPSAFTAELKNLGPAVDSYSIQLTQAPAGFDVRISEGALTVPPGATGRTGLYLIPLGQLPPPGTTLSFELKATSNTNAALNATAIGTFVVPEVRGLQVSLDPIRVSAPPGVGVPVKLTLENGGNVAEPQIELSATSPAALGISGLTSPISLAVGGSLTQTLVVTPAIGTPLDTSLSAGINVDYGSAASRRTYAMSLGVEVGIPSASAANAAAYQAGLDGDEQLAGALRTLGLTISGLFANPADPVQQGVAIANINSLLSLLGDDSLSAIRAQLSVIRDMLLSGDAASILAALDSLTAVLNDIGTLAIAARKHNFRIHLEPNAQTSQPGIPAIFKIGLQNTGSQPTTLALSVKGLPAGVSAAVTNSTVTLAPGESTTVPSAAVTDTSSTLLPFDFDVQAMATDPDAAGLTHSARGSLTSRIESVQLFAARATPEFAQAGGFVGIEARAIGALNAPRNLSFSYTVEDLGGVVVFSSPAQVQQFGVDNSQHFLSLAPYDTSFLSRGRYIVRVHVAEENGTAFPGAAEAVASFFVGSPVDATLVVVPNQVGPGDSIVQAQLNVTSRADLTAGLEVLSVTPLPGEFGGARGDFVVKDNLVYVAPGTIASDQLASTAAVVNVADPKHPVAVGTFATGPVSTFVLGGPANDRILAGGQVRTDPGHLANANRDSTFRVFSLTNPLQPTEETSAPLVLSQRQFFSGLVPHGSRVYSIASGYRFFGDTGAVFSHWGGTYVLDVSTPSAPSFVGTFFSGTKVDPISPPITINDVADGYSAGIVDVSDDVVYYLTTNGPQNDPGAGQGVLRVFNVSNPASPTLGTSLVIPEATQLLSGYRNGNQVLIVGSTGSISAVHGIEVTGNLVLTLLDVTDPLNPSILATSVQSGFEVDFVTRPLALAPGKWIVADNLKRVSDGLSVFGFVDTSAPGTISLSSLPAFPGAFPGAFSYNFHVDGNRLIVVAPPPFGMFLYSLGNLNKTSVTASVDVPKGTGVAIVPGSFNVPPSSVVDHGTYDTLTWGAEKFALPHEPFQSFDTTITWSLAVTGMKAVEGREVLKSGLVEFTYGGTSGDIPLSPQFVSSGFSIFLDPSSQTTEPGSSRTFNVQVVNALGPDETYSLKVVGLNGAWTDPLPNVSVASGESQIVPLVITPDTNAAATQYQFTVIATPVGQGADRSASVTGDIVVDGGTVGNDGVARGVVVQVVPETQLVGRGGVAHYRVRLTNTGTAADQFTVSVAAPGFGTKLSSLPVGILPGKSNYHEVPLDLIPQPGLPSGLKDFFVSATSVSHPETAGVGTGRVSILDSGVGLQFSPGQGAPGSQLVLRVTNLGIAPDTFQLALGGPIAPFSVLGQTSVTLQAGAFSDVAVTVATIPFARAGTFELLATAVSQTSSGAKAEARAEVNVSAHNGFQASFSPSSITLSQPGEGQFFLQIINTGNTEDRFTVEIVGTSADATARLVDAAGDPSLRISGFRIPGGSIGGFLLKGAKPTVGEGTITVRVTSLDRGGVPSEITGKIVVVDADDLCPADSAKRAPGLCGCGVPDTDRDEDGTPDCLDGCLADSGKTKPGICGCGVPDADSNGNRIFDCLEPPICTGLCNASNPGLDEDRDGVANCVELADRTDPCDSGSFVQKLLPTSCAGANGFLSQVNIATVVNKLSQPLGFHVEYRDSDGVLRGALDFSLPPLLKRDLLVNEMGLKPDSYGTVCVSAQTPVSGAWSGGLTLYKAHFPDGIHPPPGFGGEFDFALYYPFENPQTGSGALTLNTYSIGTDGLGLVANWVRVSDGDAGDGLPLSGRVRFYDQTGKLSADDSVSLPDGGRVDLPAHERIGPNAVGLAEFVPDDPQAKFYFEASRYFYDGVGAASKNFHTAYTIPRRPLTGAAVTARTPVRPNEMSVIELVNGSANAVAASVRLFGAGGATVGAESAFIPPKGSSHRILLDIAGTANVETAEVSGPPEAIGATTISYAFDKSGKLLYGYAHPFTESGGALQFTEFNSFIQHTNTLELSNTLDQPVDLSVRVLGFDNSVLNEFATTLAPRANSSLNVNVPKDTYGTVVVDTGSVVGVIPLNRVTRPDQYVLSFPGR
ncbi:MAG: transglutaminase domain-containing protein [Bdellovibrionota bacterium]